MYCTNVKTNNCSRNRFVANYFDGTKAFVKDNWDMIKQGAGLLALRTWLLVRCRAIQAMVILMCFSDSCRSCL